MNFNRLLDDFESILPFFNVYYVFNILYGEQLYDDTVNAYNPMLNAMTRCYTTTKSIVHIFESELEKLYKSEYPNQYDSDFLINLIDTKGYIIISLSSNHPTFPGHIFVIFKLNNKYILAESFVYKFQPKIRIFDENQIEDVLSLYISFANTQNIDVWEFATTDDTQYHQFHDFYLDYDLYVPTNTYTQQNILNRIKYIINNENLYKSYTQDLFSKQ